MKLKELLAEIPLIECHADLNMDISGVSYDSRKTHQGDLFVAVTGYAADGHAYIPAAAEKVLDLFARTSDNSEFVRMAEKIRFS